MTRISFSDGKVVMRDGKVGTEAGCCCDATAPCQCNSTFTLNGSNIIEVIFTFGDTTTETYCINDMPRPIGGVATELLCVDGQYEVVVSPRCSVRLFFSLGNFPDCDCATGELCDYILDGWENIGACDANDEVVNVETGNLC